GHANGEEAGAAITVHQHRHRLPARQCIDDPLKLIDATDPFVVDHGDDIAWRDARLARYAAEDFHHADTALQPQLTPPLLAQGLDPDPQPLVQTARILRRLARLGRCTPGAIRQLADTDVQHLLSPIPNDSNRDILADSRPSDQGRQGCRNLNLVARILYNDIAYAQAGGRSRRIGHHFGNQSAYRFGHTERFGQIAGNVLDEHP